MLGGSPDPAHRFLGPALVTTLSKGALQRWASVLGVWAVLSAASAWVPAWQTLERQLFDLYTRLSAPGGSRLPITLIGIDEASFNEIGLRWPWPRSLHAELIEALDAAGAAVIVFDILFAEASEPAEDAALAQAIAKAGSVVLAADMVYRETAYARQWLRVDPLPALLEAGALGGLAGIELDGDGGIRRVPAGADALWRVIGRRLEERLPGAATLQEPAEGALIRYLGPDHTFPYLPYHQVLFPLEGEPPLDLSDEIVIVGRDVRASPDAGAAQADAFVTPFTAASRMLTPGAEIHATLLENALTGAFLRPAPGLYAALLLGAAAVLTGALLGVGNAWLAAAGVLGLSAAMGGLGYGAFVRHGVWWPVATAIVAPLAIYPVHTVLELVRERRAREALRLAFAHYVPAQVLSEIVAHPEQLRLGGERRLLSVLFADLAGFTRLAEQLAPEQVAHLINEYLGEMTRIILAHGGTVDKFIGDAVMAFWGAPLPDPEQAHHALAAARAMQAAMQPLNARLASEGLPPLGMRIGLHQGDAVVGNMGSEARFAYSALGDAVNLASRLEGANKAYGTGILVSAELRAALGEAAAGLRPVDRVRVQGRQTPVCLHTPCDDPRVSQASAAALACALAGDLAGAIAGWTQVLGYCPDDPVAAVQLARLRALPAEPGEALAVVDLTK